MKIGGGSSRETQSSRFRGFLLEEQDVQVTLPLLHVASRDACEGGVPRRECILHGDGFVPGNEALIGLRAWAPRSEYAVALSGSEG